MNLCDNCDYNVPALVIDGNIINGEFCRFMEEHGVCIYDYEDEDEFLSSDD